MFFCTNVFIREFFFSETIIFYSLLYEQTKKKLTKEQKVKS